MTSPRTRASEEEGRGTDIHSVMRRALQAHYHRCQLYHTWERLFALAVESGISASAAEAEDLAAHLKEVVMDPLQVVNVQLRGLQGTLKQELDAREERALCSESSLTPEEQAARRAALRREHQTSYSFVRWVDRLQESERRHFELMVQLGTHLSQHIAASFLHGDQCRACLLRSHAEWKQHARHVLDEREKRKRETFMEELLALQHKTQATGTCHHSHAAPEEARHGVEEEEEAQRELAAGLPPPLPPQARRCPHLSLHDWQHCAAYRMLLLHWSTQLPAGGGGSGESSLARLREAALEEEEWARRRRAAERDNSWVARLRPVQGCDDLCMEESDDEDEQQHSSLAEEPYKERVAKLLSSNLHLNPAQRGDSSPEAHPPFPLHLPRNQKPLYPIGEEQEDTAEEAKASTPLNKPRPHATMQDHLRQVKADAAVDQSQKGSLDDARTPNAALEELAMATYEPRKVRRACVQASKALQELLLTKREVEQCISDLIEELQLELYD